MLGFREIGKPWTLVGENVKSYSYHGEEYGGAWVAQSVKHLTLAQVMVSQFMSSSPTSGSVLVAQSLEPALASVSPSLYAPSSLTLCLSFSLSKINTNFFLKKKKSLGDIFWRYWNAQNFPHIN